MSKLYWGKNFDPKKTHDRRCGMTSFVDMKTGQWVLAFYEPYGCYDRTLAEHLKSFKRRAGGWSTVPAGEIFHLHHVSRVMPKTYYAHQQITHDRAYLKKQLLRDFVISASDDKAELIALRDELYAIGVEADDAIDFAVERLARPVRRRIYGKSEKAIHALLPHIFPKSKGQPK